MKECFYCKSKGHIEKVCQKNAPGKNPRAHSSNKVTETQKAEDETEDSDFYQFIVWVTTSHHKLKSVLK